MYQEDQQSQIPKPITHFFPTMKVCRPQPKKITATLDTVLPQYLVLTVALTAPSGSGATSATATFTDSDNSTQDVLTGIPINTAYNNNTITLTLDKASGSNEPDTASFVQTITYTFQDA